MNYDAHDRFKRGDVCENMDHSVGRILGRNQDADDNYPHWIVRWDKPVHDQSGDAVYLVTSVRSVELI